MDKTLRSARSALLNASACLLFLAATLALYACSHDNEMQPASETQGASSASPSMQTPPEEASYPVIGSGDASTLVTNATGYDIIGIRIKTTGDASYGAQNSFDGFEFKDGDTVDLMFSPEDSAKSYDVLLLTSEDSKIAVRGIDLVNTKDIVFHFEQGVGFITYTDPTTGETFDNQADAMDSEEAEASIPSDLLTQAG